MYTNNPFIDNSSNPLSRFPDISTIDRNGSSSSSVGVSQTGYGYGSSPGGGGYGGAGGYSSNWNGVNGQQQQPTGYGFSQQPSQTQYPSSPYNGSAFLGTPGAATSPQMTGMYQAQSPSYSGYGQQSYTPQQQQGYGGYEQQYNAYPTGYGFGTGPNVGQQQQQTASYLAEFDPYAQPGNSSTVTGASSSTTSTGPNGLEHPRDYIQKHKRELESWDDVSWKQAFNSFEDLRRAWVARGAQCGAQVRQAGYYVSPQELAHLQGLQKEAENNTDSIMASKIQLQEMLAGYRHSTDVGSRNRVREAVNSALRSLPDWPQN